MLLVKNLQRYVLPRRPRHKHWRQASAKRRRRGEFVGAVLYGCRQVAPDRSRPQDRPEPAGVVRGIFDARIGGMSAGIAAMLNESLKRPLRVLVAGSSAARAASNFCKGR